MELIDRLDEIHGMVFRNFKYKTDKKKYGVDEHWVMPEDGYDGTQKFVGDCEDFALACRKLCREGGLDTRMVFCYDETGEGHAVLECEGWILDNRQRRVESRDVLQDKGYEFIGISGYESGDPWHYINN
jgi:predicted transglutaminase-like cysteine proteinase